MLQKLEALARQGSRVSKDAVLDLVVDLLVARGTEMKAEQHIVCADRLDVIMARASPNARSAACARLARLPTAPPSLLAAWADGPIEVAAPILQHAPNLTSADLLRTLSQAGPGHLRAAAKREMLAEDVTAFIARRGDREATVLTLLNRRAKFSEASLNALAEAAIEDPMLRGAIVHRPDLPDPVVERLWPLLDVELRARLIASGWRYSMAEIDEAGRETSAALAGAVRLGSLPQSIDTYRAMVVEGQATLSEALAEIVAAGRLVEAAHLIARTLALSDGVALNLFYGVYDRGAAVLARHADLEESVVLHIASARAQLAWVRSADTRRAAALLNAFDKAQAREIVSALEALWKSGVANTGSRRRFRSAI